MIDSDGNVYLIIDSLTKIPNPNIITSSNNITLRKINVNPCGFDKMYINKDLLQCKIYQIIYHLNETILQT